EVLELAGGLLPASFVNLCRVERIGESGQLEVFNVNLHEPEGLAFPIQDGDMVRVSSSLEKLRNVVGVHGHVERAGDFQWRSGLKLTDLLSDHDALKEKPDLDYAVIRRENLDSGEITLLSIRPRIAFAERDSIHNSPFQTKDQIFFFGKEESEPRRETIDPLLEELRTQTRPGSKALIVSVTGPVHFPGEYPMTEGMRVSNLIRAGGNMKDDAYVLSAELTRYHYEDEGGVRIEHLTIDSLSDLARDQDRDLLLKPYDNLRIKPLPDWSERGTVEIRGEVRFPGIYPIRRGETLIEALKRAGGLTEYAFSDGAVFVRESLKELETKHKEQLMARLEADLALLSVEKSIGDSSRADSTAHSLLAQLEKTEAMGRLVIDLPSIVDGKGEQPLFLIGGDKLIVPGRPLGVLVIGEVQHPTSHLFQKRLKLKDYVALSGDYTYKADKKRIFVVKADGSVGNSSGTTWFPGGSSGLHPGDTVVVPLDIDRGQGLKKLANITQIVYQMAITAAAINSF
ncbi:MAG: SLBB domain-containing protein, partial [Opitutales bacterium]